MGEKKDKKKDPQAAAAAKAEAKAAKAAKAATPQKGDRVVLRYMKNGGEAAQVEALVTLVHKGSKRDELDLRATLPGGTSPTSWPNVPSLIKREATHINDLCTPSWRPLKTKPAADAEDDS